MAPAIKRTADLVNYGVAKSPKVSTSLTNDNAEFNRMKVCVRVRPLAPREQQIESNNTIDVVDKNMLVFDPFIFENQNDQYSYRGKTYKEIGKRSNKNLQFVYDRVFSKQEDNMSVYQETTKDLVSSLLAGYNCTVFAYGSTGSGKTHTMIGSLDDPGIIFFTTLDLYKYLKEEENKNLELSVSYFEIYNEIIYDLLGPTSHEKNADLPLSLLEDANKGMTVKNLSIHQPKDAEHLLELLDVGNKNRKQHPTDANAESSRSHAIFQICLRRKDLSSNQEVSIQLSKMSLIDLAGSERAADSGKSDRSKGLQREGGNINKSLLALGNCISALASTGKQKGIYIPYRSSKLTLILRDSLGGNCQTLMIATVSPAQCHYEQSHNTLLYAERAKGVQLNVRKNNITVALQPRDYKQMLDTITAEKSKMQKTIEQLQNEVHKYKTQAECVPTDPIHSSRGSIEKLHAVQNNLDGLFAERIQLRQELLECEHKIKHLELRLMFKKADNDMITILNGETESEELKPPGNCISLFSQKLHYTDMLASLKKKVEENEEKIQRIESELIDQTNNDIVVVSYFTKNNGIAQEKDVENYQKHSDNVIEDLFMRFQTKDETLAMAHALNYRSINILKAQGLLSHDMEEDYNKIVRKIEGKKSVVWTDKVESPTMQKMKNMIQLAKLPIYRGTSLTPGNDRRNLVAVRDITPNQVNHNGSKTPFRNVNRNTPTLGNTVTKAKSSFFASPSLSKGSSVKFGEKENNFNSHSYNNNYNRKTPDRGNYWSSDSRTRSGQRSYYNNSSGYGQANGTFSAPRSNSSGYGSANSTFSAPRNKSYGYNPNFRPKYRN